MTIYEETIKHLKANKYKWVVTGAAGFIGSNLCHYLVEAGQQVIGIDSLITGKKENLKEIIGNDLFTFVEANTMYLTSDCFEGVDFCLHQAALGSIPRSLRDPLGSHKNNSTGFLNVLECCKEKDVKRVVFASSSSVYAEHLSPYAITKKNNEEYAEAFNYYYGLEYVGLRYFNVFGPRQNYEGPYAPVIPKWINQILNDNLITINGGGDTSRDFTYIDNVIQANILAALAPKVNANRIFEIGCNQSYSLKQILDLIVEITGKVDVNIMNSEERKGDIKNSRANIEDAEARLLYEPFIGVKSGLEKTIKWYRGNKL